MHASLLLRHAALKQMEQNQADGSTALKRGVQTLSARLLFPRKLRMTPAQVLLVQQSFAQLQPQQAEAAALFYDHLFRLEPGVQALFHGDIADQGKRLFSMIGQAVQLLDRPQTLLLVLRDLGQRHVGYGVQLAHYDAVGQALLLALQQGLGPALSSDARCAWTALYNLVRYAMTEGAALADEGVSQP